MNNAMLRSALIQANKMDRRPVIDWLNENNIDYGNMTDFDMYIAYLGKDEKQGIYDYPQLGIRMINSAIDEDTIIRNCPRLEGKNSTWGIDLESEEDAVELVKQGLEYADSFTDVNSTFKFSIVDVNHVEVTYYEYKGGSFREVVGTIKTEKVI